MKNLYSTNDIIKKASRQATDWEEIVTKHVLSKTHIQKEAPNYTWAMEGEEGGGYQRL